MFHLTSLKALGVDDGIGVKEAACVITGLLVGGWMVGVISDGTELGVHETRNMLIANAIKLRIFIGTCALQGVSNLR